MKFDLVHQTVSPHKRVGSGDETSRKQAMIALQGEPGNKAEAMTQLYGFYQ